MNWISVKDKMPEKRNDLLVHTLHYNESGDIIRAMMFGENEFFNMENDPELLTKVTHWIPFHEPPKG